ncbi:MAG TPA: DNA repair protein RecN [Erysipelothrix sp.]|nr:DNA repair protein RecN [Erysipelothrix sp.]
MLVSLYIKNFILIEEMRVDLSDRFNAFTGETGAGKSLFVDALNFVSGERSSAGVVGKSGDSAYVEAAFFIDSQKTIAILKTLGFEDLDDVTIFSREMMASGRSVSRINGRVVNLGSVKEVLESVLDIHSQHETQYLMNNSNHIHLLDNYINQSEHLIDYQNSYKAYLEKETEIESFKKTQYNPHDIERFKEQLKEINALNPSLSDYEETESNLREMENYEQAKSNFNTIESVLTNETNVLGSLYQLFDNFKELDDLQSRFNDVYYALEDIAYEVSKQSDALYFSEYDFQVLNERMALYTQMFRKYGDLETLLDKKNELEHIIENVEHYEDILIDLNNERDALYQTVTEKATKLTALRSEFAKELEKKVELQLKDLMLENGVFRVYIEPQPLSFLGQDRIVFMVSMNKGIDVSMLSKVASGGELSRLMLGLKVIFSEIQGISTLIFDEIDSGVSGRVAFRIGEKMKEISKKAQVISITHLPSVAACADNHYLISKHDNESKTITKIEKIEGEERVEHLAIMMTGVINEETRNAARLTLDKGQSI